MISAIDANILLDIAGNNALFYDKSAELLKRQSASGILVICQIVYSELLVFFLRKHDKNAVKFLDEFLDDLEVSVSAFLRRDFILAAEAWANFLGSKGTIQCPKCGSDNSFSCKQSHSPLLWKNHILSDFLIGAHAQNHAEVLLTRDRGYYKKYFRIKVLS